LTNYITASTLATLWVRSKSEISTHIRLVMIFAASRQKRQT